jgi:hypothetical protein
LCSRFLEELKTLNAEAAKLILHEKAEVLRRSGLLKYVEPPAGGLELIGGNENVKQHIARDRKCFTEEALSFGIDPPRGLMLTGISGCGKTQISLCTASELGIPLIQFDMGSVMSKWVGETEANARNALRQVESMAPCVLQMDEIEKGFGSVGRDGGSGAGLRAFGTVLKWMSERTCPVYMIMTANDVSRLIKLLFTLSNEPVPVRRRVQYGPRYGTPDCRANLHALPIRALVGAGLEYLECLQSLLGCYLAVHWKLLTVPGQVNGHWRRLAPS